MRAVDRTQPGSDVIQLAENWVVFSDSDLTILTTLSSANVPDSRCSSPRRGLVSNAEPE